MSNNPNAGRTPIWIKICANTNLHDAQLAAELGASAIGFVFAPSKRQVTAAQVAAITPHLPDTVEKIGVFATNGPKPASEIAQAVRTSGLTGAQLHGRPDPALIQTLTDELEGRTRLLQVIAFEANAPDPEAAAERFSADLHLSLSQPGLSAVLLDAAHSGASGGLGIAFDWKRASALVRQAFDESRSAGLTPPQLIIAGGLRAENVADAIAAFHPDGVDVASGVEASPGIKAPERLRAFLVAARGSNTI